MKLLLQATCVYSSAKYPASDYSPSLTAFPLEDISNFEQLTKDEGQASVDAASVLGAIIESLTKHFNSDSEYFQLLVRNLF